MGKVYSMVIKYLDSKRISALSSDALVAHLKFNDNVTDSAGSNGGSLIAGTATYVTGKVGNAFSLDGSTRIALANETNFDFERTDPFSVSIWVKYPNNTNKMLISKGQDPVGGTPSVPKIGIGIWTQADYINFELGASTQSLRIRISSTGIDDDTWHHLTFTYDGSSSASGARIYVDSALTTPSTVVDTLSSETILNNYAVLIGASGNGTRMFTGVLDDLRIYSRELDQSEVTMIYNSGNGTEENKPTNVQDNSILVEKDTGKRYWRTPESTSDVTWDDSTDVGCSISGNTVTKTSGNSWTSGVAKTDEVISSSSGGTITMTSNAINTYIGLSNVATLNQQAKHWYDVKLGFNQNSIVENGAIVSPDTAFTRVTSDTMKITVSSAGLVKYYINDVLKHTSTITASGTYFGIFSAYNTNETLTATITTPATWTGNFDLTGLKTYYNFEQTSTTLTNMATSVGSTDSLGSSGDATASGTISTGVTGIVGNSWDFGGGKVTASHQFIPTSGDYTFSTWVNLDDISTAGEEILRHESPQFEVWRNTSGFNVMGASGIINIEAQSNLANGVWYNIVLVHSSSGDIIYLNGVSKSTADIISVPTGTAWYLGGRASSSEAINGKIDETTVWSRALSSSEVSGLYNSGRGKIVY